MTHKNTICLWFDKDAEEAARFSAATFPHGRVAGVHSAPSLGQNDGPAFAQTEAFSFQIAADVQEETDRYWNAIVGDGGPNSQCGWCRDTWVLSWQITPRTLIEAPPAGGDEARGAFAA